MLEGPEEGGAADRERGGLGAEHDLVQQLGVDDTVPALGALGVAERGEVLVFVLEMRRAKIHPVFVDHGFHHRPRGRDVGGIGRDWLSRRKPHHRFRDQSVQLAARFDLRRIDHRWECTTQAGVPPKGQH